MKLMKRLMKKNNKGMSLVELICAVAILGLTTTALGGAMVMSAQHYYRDSAEFEVQQDAQTATNLIGNLVTDAAEADWNNNKLTITADNKTHVIYQKDDKLVYESGGEEGVLAEGLPANAFEADTSNFENNKSVNISLKVQSGEKEFTSNYNATSRNGELSTTALAEKVCAISMEDEVVIEPYQSYGIKVDLNGGMTIPEVGGIQVDWTNALSDWKNDTAIKYDGASEKVVLTAPANADGSFQFEVKTGFKPNTTTYWDTQTVDVKVRRVEAITINRASGSGYTAGSEYVFAASVVGDNLSKGYGRDYDNDYKNPKWVDFQISGVNYTVLEDKSKTDTPYIKIKLTSDMAAGDVFMVKAVSTHAAIGKVDVPGAATIFYNKSGVAYDTSMVATWSDTCPAAPAPIPTIDPDYPKPVLPSGLMRGEDYTWDTSTNDEYDKLKQKLESKYSTTVKYQWFVSFKESSEPDTAWEPWHMTKQTGNNQKIDGTFETTIMLPDKAYDLRFFVLYYDQNTREVLYPHDESLLAQGNGLSDAGFVKGWADEDAAATSFMQYGNKTSLPEVSLYYYDSDINLAKDYVGSVSAPIVYDFKDGGITYKFNFNMRHLTVAKGTYTYNPVVWKKDGDSWKKLEKEDVDKIMSISIPYGTNRYVEVFNMQNISNTKDTRSNVSGIYRIGIELGGTAKGYVSDKADTSLEDSGYKDVTINPTMKLYDENGTNGFIYFKIQDTTVYNN